MQDAWSDAIKEAYASAPVDVVIWPTLELNHPTFNEPARVVVDQGELMPGDPPVWGRRLRIEAGAPVDAGQLVTFLACNLTATLPAADEKQAPEMSISLDNVPGLLMQALDQAVTTSDPIDVIYREYMADDPDTVHFKLDGLTLRRVTATMVRIEGKAGFLDLFNRQFLTDYTSQEFPSLAL